MSEIEVGRQAPRMPDAGHDPDGAVDHDLETEGQEDRLAGATTTWAKVRQEWKRREDRTFRTLLLDRIGPEVLTLWVDAQRNLAAGSSRAVPQTHHEHDQPTDVDGDPVEEFRSHIGKVLREMVGVATRSVDVPPGLGTALVLAFVYLEALIAWENSDDPADNITVMIAEMADIAQDDTLVNRGDGSPYVSLIDATCTLASALEHELATENALFCACAIDFGRQASRVVDALATAGPRIDDGEPNRGGGPSAGTGATGSPDPFTRIDGLRADVRSSVEANGGAWSIDQLDALELAELLLDDASTIRSYFTFLRDAVAPGCTDFLKALEREQPAATAVERLARNDLERVPATLQGDVFASEARSHLQALREMHRSLAMRDVLWFTEAEIILVFPFGLPEIDGDHLWERLHRLAKEPHQAHDRLIGLPINVEDTWRTDSWENWGNTTATDRPNRQMAVTFRDHQVRLTTTAPIRYPDLRVEIRIGELGNHYVRVAVRTDDLVHLVAGRDDALLSIEELTRLEGWNPGDDLPDAHRWVDLPEEHQGWSPHAVDQWIRRAGYESGSESIELVGRDGQASDGESYGQIVELATKLVQEFAAWATPSAPVGDHGEPAEDGPRAGGDKDFRDEFNDLHASSHVVVIVGDALLTAPDGAERELRDPQSLTDALGGSVVFLPQRPLPATLDEWVRFRPEPRANLIRGIGLPGDLITRSTDVTLMCMLGSPNWAVLPQLEIVEFSASLSGIYKAWSVWLRAAVVSSHRYVKDAQRSSDEDLLDLLRHATDTAGNLSRVRSLIDHVGSDQLIRTGTERTLLDRLVEAGGLNDAQRSLMVSVEALTAQHQLTSSLAEKWAESRRRVREEIEAETEAAAEARQDLLNIFVGVLTVFGLVGVFQWVNAEYFDGPGGWRFFWEVAVLFLVLVAILAVAWRIRIRPNQDDTTGQGADRRSEVRDGRSDQARTPGT